MFSLVQRQQNYHRFAKPTNFPNCIRLAYRSTRIKSVFLSSARDSNIEYEFHRRSALK